MEDGELVEKGGFRLDRARAIERLSSVRFEDPRAFVSSLVRVAVACGARAVDFDVAGRELRVAWDGRPLPGELLGDPLAGLLGTGAAPEAGPLGAAFLGALQSGAESVEAWAPGAEAAAVWARSGADGSAPPPAARDRTRLVVRWPSVTPLGLAGVVWRTCAAAPAALTFEGRRVGVPPTALDIGLSCGRLLVWPARRGAPGSSLRPYIGGAGADPVPVEGPAAQVSGALFAKGVRLDVSLTKAVRDARLDEGLAAARAVLPGVAKRFAEEHERESVSLRGYLSSRALAACWGEESPEAAEPVARFLEWLGMAAPPSWEERRAAAHAGRRARWLQEASAVDDAAAACSAFPCWDGRLRSADELARAVKSFGWVPSSVSRALSSDSHPIVRLFRSDDDARLRRALDSPRVKL